MGFMEGVVHVTRLTAKVYVFINTYCVEFLVSKLYPCLVTFNYGRYGL